VLTLSRFATSGIFKSDESRKPYLVQYLRDRDLRGFQTILQGITAPQPGDCRRVVLRCFAVLLLAVRHRFPLLSEAEM